MRWRTQENVARSVPLEPDEQVLYWENLGLYVESLLGSPWKYVEAAVTDRKIILFEFRTRGLRAEIVGLKRPFDVIPLAEIEKYWQEESWGVCEIFIETRSKRYKMHISTFVQRPPTITGRELTDSFLSAISTAISIMKEKEKQEKEKERRMEIYEYKYSFADVKIDPQMGTLSVGCPFCHAPKPEGSVGNEIRCGHCGQTYLIPPGMLGPSAPAEDRGALFCKGCGSRLRPGSRYCPRCGRPLT